MIVIVLCEFQDEALEAKYRRINSEMLDTVWILI
jgi:hypothetical protein